MSRHPLDSIRVAKPCDSSWDSMYGDDRVRFCSSCKLNVYNLSGMSRREVNELFDLVEGRLCVRFFRRTDGTLLTRDCPVGMSWTGLVARAAAFLLAASVPFWGAWTIINWRDIQATIAAWIQPASPVMGKPARPAEPEVLREDVGETECPPVVSPRPLDTGCRLAPPTDSPFRARLEARAARVEADSHPSDSED